MSNELRDPATAAGGNDSEAPDAPPAPTAAAAVEPFPSLSALRAAHSSLLEAHRTQATVPDFWAEVELFLRRGQATGALLDNEGDRGAAQSLLDYWTATAYSVGRKVADALLLDFDPALAPEIPDDRCPYVGLAAFREGQGSYFFGRRQLVETLLAKVANDRLLAIVGPSGSGKSSVVLAGLLTALKAGALAATAASAASDQWRYSARMVPGSDPLTNLARAIQPTQGIDTFDVALAAKFVFAADTMRGNSDTLVKLVAESGLQPLVLIIDQFEELFTLCTDEGLRGAFIDNLLELIQAPGARHTVILTMRTDFESYVARLPTFQPFFDAAIVRVTPLNAAELRACSAGWAQI
jgi:energy-coupling factor transporter ATP-binding protein EcfA2